MKINHVDRPYFYLLLVTGGLLVLHQIAQRLLDISLPFVDSYLDPFLSIPFLLSGFALERRWFFRMRDFQLDGSEILIATTALALLFEFVFPHLISEYIYDSYDFIAYAAGGLLFYLFAKSVD